jgi:hypothetical protein
VFPEDLGPCVLAKKNPSRTHGWDEVKELYEGKGSHCPCQVRDEKKEGPGSFGRSSLYHLNSEMERDYIITWIL